MMKALAGLAIVAMSLHPDTGVRMGPEGVLIGGAPVVNVALELRQTEFGALLVSSVCLEPVTATIDVSVADGMTLALEPGVRARKSGAGLLLSVHGNKWVRLETADGVIKRRDSILVKVREGGWDCGDGRVLTGPRLLVSVQQDDPDKNLEKMEESAKKLDKALGKDENETPVDKNGRSGVRTRRVFTGDPTVGGNSADSNVLRRIREASPAGF